jgi:hypothetical protein
MFVILETRQQKFGLIVAHRAGHTVHRLVAGWDQSERLAAMGTGGRNHPLPPPTTNIRACVTELSRDVKLKLIAKQNKTFF